MYAIGAQTCGNSSRSGTPLVASLIVMTSGPCAT